MVSYISSSLKLANGTGSLRNSEAADRALPNSAPFLALPCGCTFIAERFSDETCSSNMALEASISDGEPHIWYAMAILSCLDECDLQDKCFVCDLIADALLL